MASIDIIKLKTIVSYLADNVEQLYVTKLMKLLYYIDFISLAERGSSITNDTYYKLPYGPVPSFTKNEIDNLDSSLEKEIKSQFADIVKLETPKDNFGKLIKNKKKYDPKILSAYEKNLIDAVVSKLGGKTAVALSAKTHKEKPYRLTSFNSIIDQSLAATLKGREILN
jgi:uncharacterized phage-associated protein